MESDTENIDINGDAFLSYLSSRHCKRSFYPTIDISDSLIEKVLLSAAEGTPSTQNTQPWGVTIIKGDRLKSLSELFLDKFDKNEMDQPEYQNRPNHPTLPEFDEKIQIYGKELFELKQIDRSNEVQRKLHSRENFTFYNAPVLLLIHIPKRSVSGTFLDIGAFIQSLLLGFLSFGIGSCPQYSLTNFSETLRNQKGENGQPYLPENQILVCGMSIGYPIPEDKMNSFSPTRQPPEKWIRWLN